MCSGIKSHKVPLHTIKWTLEEKEKMIVKKFPYQQDKTNTDTAIKLFLKI